MSKHLVVFVLLVVVAKSIQDCPDRFALHNVSLWIHLDIDEGGEYRESISLNDAELEHYKLIDVVKANVSVLCDGMIKRFRNLQQLSLIDANISKILPEAFQQLPRLTHLSLAVNHLTTINRNQLKNLENLQVLFLSKNQIEDIEEDAFNDLVNITKIYLDRNRIFEINSKWFLSNLKLSLIDLSFNNISKLQTGAFTLSKNRKVKIRLQHNLIDVIETSAVISEGSGEEKADLTLHLDHNSLVTISGLFIKTMDTFRSNLHFPHNNLACIPPDALQMLKQTSVLLDITDNPLTCDCMETINYFVKDHVLNASFYYTTSLECDLHGLKITEWP